MGPNTRVEVTAVYATILGPYSLFLAHKGWFSKIIKLHLVSSKPQNMLLPLLCSNAFFAWLIIPSPTSEFNNIIRFLYYAKPHLQAVIEDAQQGVESQHGFAAFFKSSTNIRRVTGILQDIVNANPLIVDEDRARTIKTHTPQPRFVCIKEDDESVANITKLCSRSLRYGINTADPMLIFPGKERIAVCPSFFRVAHFRPPPCPTLTSDGKFEHQAMTLMRTSFAYFVYALAMMYNRDMWTAKLDYGKLSDMQDATLPFTRSLLVNVILQSLKAKGAVAKAL
ncbi:MAG: hypothetical protein Q9203_004228 [Teloschistes exilis]